MVAKYSVLLCAFDLVVNFVACVAGRTFAEAAVGVVVSKMFVPALKAVLLGCPLLCVEQFVVVVVVAGSFVESGALIP